MSTDDIEDREEPPKQKKTLYYLKEDKPKDLVTLFLNNLDKMSKTENSYEDYKLLRLNINIGKIILKKSEHEQLKKEITTFLTSETSYLKKRDMELQDAGRFYKCGSDNTGNIAVKPEELNIGRKEALNQECDKLIPKLVGIHDKLFEAIVEEEYIKRERKEIDEIIDEIINEELKNL